MEAIISLESKKMRGTNRESHRPPGFARAGLRKARVDYHAVAHVRAPTYTMRGLAACIAVSVMDGSGSLRK